MKLVRADREAFGAGAFVFTLLMALFTFSALGLAGVAYSNSKDAKSAADKANGTQVSLSEFAISPKAVSVAAGASLTVANHGTVEHNLAVKGTSYKTAMIAPGSSAPLDLRGLKPGAYTIMCEVPGHASAGMTGTLTVGGGSASMAGMDMGGGTNTAANDAMDNTMAAPTKAFPAKTAGLGGQMLAPVVQPDGTKEFDLTAKVVQWEVSPGKKVDAWTYNGAVPGPTIQVQPGDKVRVVLKNELPESTTIHFHGLQVPNSMDGVPDITQPPVKPGQSFVYEFVAQGPAVGMYHSHDDAAKQVPNGLAGAFLVGQEPLPAGVTVSQRLPIVLNDAGTIGLTINGKSFPATAPIVAKLGDWVEMDYFDEGLQIHPMHLHGLPQLVIAKDGYPLPQPYEADTLQIAPGERYTVLVHTTEPGTWAFHCHILTHAESDQGMFGMVTAFVVK